MDDLSGTGPARIVGSATPGDAPDRSEATVMVRVRRLHPDAVLPRYAMAGDAGADLTTVEDVELAPGERVLVATGIAIELPDGWAGFVHPRSGLAARSGISIVNAPGTIDSGYRGEVKVNLINLDPCAAVQLRRGDRIAQLIIQRVAWSRFVEVEELTATDRAAGGHGSTGGAPGLGAV